MSKEAVINHIDTIEEERGITQSAAELSLFMVESCELIQDKLPDVAKQGLEVAKRYWTGKGTEQEVEAARVRSWEYIDAAPGGGSLENQNVCATRAVICLLFPNWAAEEGEDHLHWFVEVLNKVEDHWDELAAMLERRFADHSQ